MEPSDMEYETLAQKGLEEVRFVLQMDGGDIRLVSVEEGGRVVKICFEGMCAACPVNSVTLNGVVKKALKKYLPQLEKVADVDLEGNFQQ